MLFGCLLVIDDVYLRFVIDTDSILKTVIDNFRTKTKFSQF